MIFREHKKSKCKGHIDEIVSNHIRGWAYNPEQPDESMFVKITSEANDIIAVGKATKYREDLDELGYNNGKVGFLLPISETAAAENIGKKVFLIDESNLIVQSLEVTESVILRHPLSLESILQLKEKCESNELDASKYYALLDHYISGMASEKQWNSLEILLNTISTPKEYQAYAALTYDFINKIAQTDSQSNVWEKPYLERQIDLTIKFCNLDHGCKLQHPQTIEAYEVENLISNYLAFRKENVSDFLASIDKVFFNSDISNYHSDSFRVANEASDAIFSIPLLPTSPNEACSVMNRLNELLSCHGYRSTYSCGLASLSYLMMLTVSKNGQKVLRDNKVEFLSVLNQWHENLSTNAVEARYKGFLLDIDYITAEKDKVYKQLLEILDKPPDLYAWSCKFLIEAICDYYPILSDSYKARADLVLCDKFTTNRLTAQGLCILADITILNMLEAKTVIDYTYIRKLLSGLIESAHIHSVAAKIDEMFSFPVIKTAYSAEYLVYKGYLQSLSGKPLIETDHVFHDSNILIARNCSEISSRFVHIDELKEFTAGRKTFISTAQNKQSSEYATRLCSKIGFSVATSKPDANLVISFADDYIISLEFFFVIQKHSNRNLSFIDQKGRQIGAVDWVDPDILETSSIEVNDCMLFKGEDANYCYRNDYGLLRTDDIHASTSYLDQLYSYNKPTRTIRFGKDSINEVSVNANAIRDSELVAFITQRNEQKRLELFLEYYRELGVQRFIVIDNISDDKTDSFLLKQDDVDFYSTPQPYSTSTYGVGWIDIIMRRYRQNKWSLILDPDEQLVCPNESLIDYIRDLDAEGYDALYVPLIDVYPKGEVKSHPIITDNKHADIIYYDRRWFSLYTPYGGYIDLLPTFQGGIRYRKFGLPSVVLNKVPLMKLKTGMTMREGVHWLDGANIKFDESKLFHHKYNLLFHDYVAQESRRGEHWNGGLEYKVYHRELMSNNDLVLYDELYSTNLSKGMGL